MYSESHSLDQLGQYATAEKHLYYGVSWETYLQMHELVGDSSNVRLTFSHGVLEIMSPKRLHEQIARLTDMVVTLLAFGLGLNVDNCGAMTLHFESAQRGGEPDNASRGIFPYHLAHNLTMLLYYYALTHDCRFAER